MLNSFRKTVEIHFWLASSLNKLKEKIENLFYVSIDCSPWTNSMMSAHSLLKKYLKQLTDVSGSTVWAESTSVQAQGLGGGVGYIVGCEAWVGVWAVTLPQWVLVPSAPQISVPTLWLETGKCLRVLAGSHLSPRCVFSKLPLGFTLWCLWLWEVRPTAAEVEPPAH